MRLVAANGCRKDPGAALGAGALVAMRAYMGDGANAFPRICIGMVLILSPAPAFFQGYLTTTGKKSPREHLPRWITPSRGAIGVRLVGGSLVGMTPIGSGSVIMTLLVLFYRHPLTTLVGTDIAHAVILATVVSVGHLTLRTVDFRLLAALLPGSISLVCRSHRTSMQTVWVRTVLFSLIVVVGMSMF
jgi:uncharacterized protein